MIITITNSGPFEGQQMLDVVAVAKGLIGPEDLANGGTMSPQAASKIISMMFDNPFLSKITTERMTRLTKDVDVMDMAARQLVRVPEGTDPDEGDFASADEYGSVLTALPVQLFPSLKLSFLRANKDNPKLVAAIEKAFNTRLNTDVIDLGFNGVADDGAGANRAAKFIRLNKGWLQILRDWDVPAGATDRTLDIDPATDGWISTLAAVMAHVPEDYRDQSTFIMNTAHADAYARELGSHVTGTPLTADSPLRRFEGKPIEAQAKMPQGKVLFTPMSNLVFGVHTDVQRDRAYHTRKRALEYTYDMSLDYQIAVKQAAGLGESV